MSETIAGTSFPSEPATAGSTGEGLPPANRAHIPVESPAAYWRRQFCGAPVLNLPADRPRPATPAAHFAWRSRSLGKNFADRLRRFSQDEQVPFSIVLFSVFEVLLLRYTSQEDLVIGCTLGDFPTGDSASRQNAFLLRADLVGDPSFRDLVSQTYDRALEAVSRGSSSLPELVEELTASLGVEAPTFQVSFCFRSGKSQLECESSESQTVIPQVPVDLHLEIADDKRDLALHVLYNRDLFDVASIDRTLQNLETLLQGVVQGAGQRLSSLPILTEAEEHQILIEWNGNVQDQTLDKCLHELVEAQAERCFDRPAVAWGDHELTYQEFNRRANQMAHYLRRCGVGPNVRVGICLEPAFDFAISLLAVLKSGGACVPLDPKYPQERLAYMLEDVQARVLVTQKGMLAGDAPDGCQTLMLAEITEALASEPTSNPESGVTADDIAYVIYTSGSTGKPRGVLLAHAGLANYVTAMSSKFGLGPNDRMLQFCSISFDIAVEEIFTTWARGATLVLRQADMPLAVPEFLAWVEQRQITVLDLPTAYWHEWVHHFPELKTPIPASVRLVIVGGERASAKAYAAWSQAAGGRIRWINTYGPTEASICVTAFEPNFTAGEPLPENIPIGRPVPNCRVYLLDRCLNPVPVGIPGELHIGGVCVARAYHNRPELTREKFIP